MAIDTPFVWGRGGKAMSYEELERQKLIEEKLAAQGADTSPVQHWTQGAARVANAIAGAFRRGNLADAEEKNAQTNREAVAKAWAALSGGAGASASASSAAPPAKTVAEEFPTSIGVVQDPNGTSGDEVRSRNETQRVTAERSQPISMGEGQQAFIESMLPHAVEASKATGIDPRIILAQGALESAWGKSAPGNNFFGIKSHGQGGGQTLATTEVVNGQPVKVNDSFRTYGGVADSVKGYADFINSNPRYAGLKQAQGLDAQIEALQASGYATDPNYGAKIRQIASGIKLPDQPVQVASADPSFAPQSSEAQASPVARVAQAVPQQAAQAPSAPVQRVAQALPPELLDAMTNPALSPQTRAIAQMVLQQRMQQQEAARGEALKREGWAREDSRFEQTHGLDREKFAYEKSKKPTEVQEYEYGLQNPGFFARQEDLRKAGATQNSVQVSTERKGNEAMVSKGVEMFDASQKAAIDASKRIASYGQMAKAMEGFTPGATAESRLATRAILKDLGVIKGDDVPDAEAFKAVQRRLELLATPKGQGQITENERVLIRETIPSITSSPESIPAVLGMLQRLDEYDIKVADIARANAQRNQGVPNYLEIVDEIRALGSPMSLEEQSALQALTEKKAAPPPAASPPDASGNDGWTTIDGVKIRRKQ